MFPLVLIIGAAIWLMVGFYFGTQYKRILDDIKKLQEHHEPKVAEIIVSSPRKTPVQVDDGSSMVVTTKSPRQLEKEAKEEVDRIGGLI